MMNKSSDYTHSRSEFLKHHGSVTIQIQAVPLTIRWHASKKYIFIIKYLIIIIMHEQEEVH